MSEPVVGTDGAESSRETPPFASADRYVQVGWWNEREGHMMPLYCAGPKAGYTPLYVRQWPLADV